MLSKTVILFITLCTAKIGSQKVPKYRFDYSFSEQANGWLKFHRVPAIWNDAMLRCHAEGAVLASPLTGQLQNAILKHVSNESAAAIFTGVNSVFSRGDFSSIEGIPLLRLPITWAVGEPNSLDNSENCMMMMTNNGAVADVKCTDVLPYVCYKKRIEIVLTECGTTDREYELDLHTGSCYKFHHLAQDWPKAYMTCVAEGGHLAVINSDHEETTLKNFFEKKADAVHGATLIGYRDMRNGGSWKTIHGETIPNAGYNRWDTNQPDNSTVFAPEGENCGSIHRSGLLNDVWCGWVLTFICEKKPDSLLEQK